MVIGSTKLKLGVVVAVLALALTSVAPAANADDHEYQIKARAISTMNIIRAASDLLDIKVSRWSTDDERDTLVKILETQGNHALAATRSRGSTSVVQPPIW